MGSPVGEAAGPGVLLPTYIIRGPHPIGEGSPTRVG